jgi:DNA-binding NarL/FixJ family response regulator
MRVRKAVIVDDEFLITDYLTVICKGAGVEVAGIAHRPDEAYQMVMEKKPDFVLMDVRLKAEEDGVDVSNRIHAELPETKIIFITGSNEPSTIQKINSDHPYRILIKPINPKDLVETLQSV